MRNSSDSTSLPFENTGIAARFSSAAVLLCLLCLLTFPFAGALQAQENLFKFSIVSDIHYQNLTTELSKLRVADYVDTMLGWNPAFVVQNGDLIEGWGSQEEVLAALISADSILDYIPAPRYNVMGNHELGSLPLNTVMAVLGMDSTYYSFDRGGYHFIVLNAAYDTLGVPGNVQKGCIPIEEEAWLVNDLNETELYTMIFIHFDIDGHYDSDTTHSVYGREHIRNILANSGKVVAVFQGHRHASFEYIENGVAYYLVDNAGYEDVCTYTKVKLYPDEYKLSVIRRPELDKYDYYYGPRPPFPFDLREPADEIVLPSTQDTLRWGKAFDIDPDDEVVYSVHYDTDPLFTNPTIVSGIDGTSWAIDPPLANDTEYYWKVVAVDGDGLERTSKSVYSFHTPADTVVSSAFVVQPLQGASIVGFPNPFAGSVTLKFYVENPGAAVRIYDVKGRLVRTLDERIESSGWNSLFWDATSQAGEAVSSGVYFGVIEMHGARKACKLLLLK